MVKKDDKILPLKNKLWIIYFYKNLLILVLDKNTKGFIYGFKYELCIDLHIIAACAFGHAKELKEKRSKRLIESPLKPLGVTTQPGEPTNVFSSMKED